MTFNHEFRFTVVQDQVATKPKGIVTIMSVAIFVLLNSKSEIIIPSDAKETGTLEVHSELQAATGRNFRARFGIQNDSYWLPVKEVIRLVKIKLGAMAPLPRG
jgi:hypothetical protein